MESYGSEEHADLAVKLAALYIPDNMEALTEDNLASAMSSMVKQAELDLSPEQAAMLMAEGADEEGPAGEAAESMTEAAEASSSQAAALLEAAQALEAASDAGIGDEEAARMVVAHLKAANSAANNPDASALGGAGLGGKKGDKEHDGIPDAFAHLNGKQGPKPDAKGNVGHEVALKPLAEGVNLDAKTAAAILRKLSEDAAMGGDASALGGDHDKDKENDGREEGYANMDGEQGISKKVDPDEGHKVEIAGEPGGEKLPKQAAYNFLLAKTAEEVGAFLPYGLNQQEKLAALRTMMGMSNPERAEYISRIKLAMEEGSEDKDDKDDEDKYKGMPEGLRKALMKKEEGNKDDDDEDKDDSEKEAAYILRQLGLGV
tara:strand:+ start:1449 stop:2573 length:1125 start_codon:yes stop_codon:yes gene_type:complete